MDWKFFPSVRGGVGEIEKGREGGMGEWRREESSDPG